MSLSTPMNVPWISFIYHNRLFGMYTAGWAHELPLDT
jgi:hypothetical protein